MKEKELKRLEDIESKIMELESELSVVYKRISEPLAFILVDPKGGETSRKPYERELREPIITNTSNEPLDLTKILEVGDEVTTERFGDVRITRTDDRWFGGLPIRGLANDIWRTWTREGFWDANKKEVERLKPKNGKTWAQFIAEKEEKKQQIPTLEKAIEAIKKRSRKV